MRAEPKSLPKVEVPVAGFNRPVTVLIFHGSENLPEGISVFAPDTRRAEPFVAIDRGANFYGSLREDFFVCRDGDYEYKWAVLWVTLNADQMQDSVQRLKPFCMLSADWQPDNTEDHLATALDELDTLELEGMILLWAYANYATDAWSKDFLTRAKVAGGLLTADVAASVVQAGMDGMPLELLRLGRKGN